MRRRRGFTLVELLVVIGIIAALIAILLPALGAVRRSAGRAKAGSNLKQLLTGYLAYTQDNKGCLLLGYPPNTVNGVPVTAQLANGTDVAGATAIRYPWRLIKYVGNIWPIVYYYDKVPTDDYQKGFYAEFGLNSVFLGGHNSTYFAGYINPDKPNKGKHIMWRDKDIRRASEQIVFTESRRLLQPDFDGYYFVFPPRANSVSANKRWWVASTDGSTALAQTTAGGGMPMGRYGKMILTGFFDGHVDSMTARQLEDMRYWNSCTDKADYDFVP